MAKSSDFEVVCLVGNVAQTHYGVEHDGAQQEDLHERPSAVLVLRSTCPVVW